MVLAKREHSQLGLSHVDNYYVIDAECENHRKQLFHCEF